MVVVQGSGWSRLRITVVERSYKEHFKFISSGLANKHYIITYGRIDNQCF